MTIPSLTKKVSGAQLTFTQPVRSLPLNIGTKPSSGFSSAGEGTARARTVSTAAQRISFMVVPPHRLPGATLRRPAGLCNPSGTDGGHSPLVDRQRPLIELQDGQITTRC